MSDVGCDLAGTLRLNANSICCQDEECIQLHPDMHDAMPVFPENKNCTVIQTRTRRGKKNTPQSSTFILQGIKSGGYYMARACVMHQRSEHMNFGGKS